jgi:low temperature requirement protein LtrA
MMVLGLDSASEAYRSALRFTAPNIVAMAIIVGGGFIDGDGRRLAWIAGIAVFIVATIQAGSGQWIIRAGHFAERHGLIIIVALGEVIVAIGQAVVIPLQNSGGFSAESVIALVAAGALAGLLWWAYFDRVGPALEHRAEALAPVDRGRFARDVYTYSHAPIVAGIILSAVAMEEMALHPSDPLPGAFRAMGAAGLALYFSGVGIGVYRSFRAIAFERVAAVVAVALLMLVGSDVDAVVLLIGIVVILFATLVIEQIRIEGPSTHGGRDSVDDARVGDDIAN